MLGELVPCSGGPPIPLLKPKLLLGRQDACDVALRFPTVSGRHCELELKEGYWFVRDLGSSNGTRVNGKACTTQWLLPKDMLALAQFAYTVAYTPPADRPPPPRIEGSPSPGTPPAPTAKGVQPVQAPAPKSAAPKDTPALMARPPHDAGVASSLGSLVPCGGGDPIPLHKPVLVVGRGPACDIVLRSPTVSTRHCQLEWANGSWTVRDLDSRNGVRVDGVPCKTECVPPGSVLWIASLRFQIVYTAAGAAPVKKQPAFAQGLLEKAGLMQWQRKFPAATKDEGEKPKTDEKDEAGRMKLE